MKEHAARYLADLEEIPESAHRRMARWFAGADDGGVHIGNGSVPSASPATAHLKGVTPRGWEISGRTWDDVPGAYVPSARQVILGDEGRHDHGAESLARHEFAHGIDHMLGNISSTERWRQVVGYALGATMHPYLKFEHNPTGLWSEAFAEGYAAWAHAVAVGEDPVTALANALHIVQHRYHPQVRQSLRDTIKFFEEVTQ